MNTKSKSLRLLLAFSLILSLISYTSMKFSLSANNSGGAIDIYTQKEPFDGKGVNASSDAFGPEDEVIIYASVTYNDYPISMAHVAFEIHGPENPVYNITFLGYAQTNDAGVANLSFRIGLIEEINFGEWKVIGTANVGGKVQDFLSFKVGWIVEIVLMRTVDENHVEKTKFIKTDILGVELSLRNNAMVDKNVTIAITLYDQLKIVINSTSINNLDITPNSTQNVSSFLTIPQWASAGKGTVTACAYTLPPSLGGVPYCPQVSENFLITDHDMAILNIITHPKIVYEMEEVNIDITVKNLGQEIEASLLSVYYNETNHIDSLYFSNLEPNANLTLDFTWDTSNVTPGFYQIGAYVEPVPGETDTSDNRMVDDIIEVRPGIKRYYLIVKTDPSDLVSIPGENWYDEGSNLNLTATPHISISPGVRYGLSFWDVDGIWKRGNPILVTMDTNHTATAHYTLQYHLTIFSPYGTPSGEKWYNANTIAYAALNTGIVDHKNGTRRIFAAWSGDFSGTRYNKSSPIVMNSPKTAVANWKTEYQVTFSQSGLDSSTSGTVVTVEGISKTFNQFPYKTWIEAGTELTFSYQNVTSTLTGKRFILQNSTISLSSPILVTNPVTLIANYKIQYYLTVNLDPSGITETSRQGWYDRYQNVTLTTRSVTGYAFKYWDIDGFPQNIGIDTVTIHMDAPHTATAYYTVPTRGWYPPTWLWWLISLLILLTILLIIWVHRRRKREKAEESFLSGWTAWYYCYNP